MNYDSSGLMAQIQALIAAPTTSRTRTNNKHPYFRRPGRGHNHDTCDACHEAGDLLCCDTCSASFHLMCVNPPLDYEQIPAGDWRCHRCLSTQAEGGCEEIINRKAHPANRRAGKKRAAPPPPVEPPSKKPALNEKSKRIIGKDGKVVEKFFTQAVEWAKKLNPEQFVLPKYLMEYGASQFPGAARPSVKKGASKANKQVVEMENGMVPSPIIVCFVCDISCRRGPMIKCDACSAFFHFECLNPPLTGIPQGRWLCHLHPEPTLEHKRLKSLSLTERVRLYDYAKQPIDPIQVALRFVTKTQRAKYSYFRSKVPIRGKDFTEIPGAIVHCYNEEDDSPNLPEWPKLDEIPFFNHENIIDLEMEDDDIKDATKTIRTGSVAASLSPLDLLAQVAAKEMHTSSVQTSSVPPSTAVVSNVDSNGGINSEKLTMPVHELSDLDKTTSAKDKEELLVTKKANLEKKFEEVKKEKSLLQEEDVLEGLDLDTIMFLAAQKVRELRCTETMESTNNHHVNANSNSNSNVSNRNSRSNSLHENETNFMNLNGDNFDIDSPPQLVPNSVHVKDEREKSGSDKQKPFGEERLMEINDPTSGTTGNAEEDKLGLGRDSRIEIPVPYIKLRILNCHKELTFKEGQIMIGRGHVELNLPLYSPCESITDEHCCIYYDYVGSRWELINYSPNGTIVNKVPYGCDPKTKTSNKAAPLQENLRLATSYMNDIKPKPNKSKWRESLQGSNSCHCRERSVHQIWESMEGSAYLEKGSRIQVGCVRILVTETGNKSKLVPREWYVFNPVARIPETSANECNREDHYNEDKVVKPTRRNGTKASKETDIDVETDSGEDQETKDDDDDDDDEDDEEKAEDDLSDQSQLNAPVVKGKPRKRVTTAKNVKASLQKTHNKFHSGPSRSNATTTSTTTSNTGSVGRGGGRGRGRGRGRIASNVSSRKRSVDNPPVAEKNSHATVSVPVPVKKVSTRGRKRKVSIVPIIDVDEVVITTDDNDKDDNDNNPSSSNNNNIKNSNPKTNTKISNNNNITNNHSVDCTESKNNKSSRNPCTIVNADKETPVPEDKKEATGMTATTTTSTPSEEATKSSPVLSSRDPQTGAEKPEKHLTEREGKGVVPVKENSVSVVIGDHDYDGPHTNRTIRRQQPTHVNSITADLSTKDGEKISRSSDEEDANISQNSTHIESSLDSS